MNSLTFLSTPMIYYSIKDTYSSFIFPYLIISRTKTFNARKLFIEMRFILKTLALERAQASTHNFINQQKITCNNSTEIHKKCISKLKSQKNKLHATTYAELTICFLTLKLSKIPAAAGSMTSPVAKSRPTSCLEVSLRFSTCDASSNSLTIVSWESCPEFVAKTFGTMSNASANALTPKRARPLTVSSNFLRAL